MALNTACLSDKFAWELETIFPRGTGGPCNAENPIICFAMRFLPALSTQQSSKQSRKYRLSVPSYNIASEPWKQCATSKGQIRDSPHAAARLRRPSHSVSTDRALGHGRAKWQHHRILDGNFFASRNTMKGRGDIEQRDRNYCCCERKEKKRKEKHYHDNSTMADRLEKKGNENGKESTCVSYAQGKDNRYRKKGKNQSQSQSQSLPFPRHRTIDDAMPSKPCSFLSPPRKHVVGH